MLTNRHQPRAKTRLGRPEICSLVLNVGLGHYPSFYIVLILIVLCADSLLFGDNSPQKKQGFQPVGHQVVVLLDINPHQKKVLALELALAERVIQKLDQPGNVFTVVTFGSQSPVLTKARVQAAEASAAIRSVTTEQTREKYFSVHFHDGLNVAFEQFVDDTRLKSVLVISEGNDYFPDKTFEQTVSRAWQLQVTCNAAMVADHTFYGTKGIQRYGFELRRLAKKTQGRYVEVGASQKKIQRSADQLSENILNQELNSRTTP